MNNKASSTAPKSTRKAAGISRSFIAALSRNLALATLAALGLSRAEATNYSWDPGLTAGAAIGGAGTWDLTTANWFDGVATDVLWPNNISLTDVAVFGGAGGLVTIDTATDTGVAANGLIFNSGGYTISGAVAGEVINLGGTTPTITVTNAADTDSISAILTGTGLVKNGAGRLNLTGVNTFTGTVSVLGGTLGIAADANLGVAANTVTLDSGTLSVGGTFTSARAITLGAGGGTINVDPTFTFTASTALAANANALTKTGTGALSLGGASTRTGTTAVNGGTLTATNLSAVGTGLVTVGTGATYEINTAAGTSVQAVTLSNGGTFQWTQNAQLTVGATGTLSFQGTGGTIFVGGSGSTGKVLVGAGLIASDATATVTKTGGGVMQLSGANTNFLGSLAVNAGTVEFQNADSLGTAVKNVTVNSGGEFVTSAGISNRNTFTLNTGGTISANTAGGTFAGAITMTGNANAALRQFQTTTTAISFNISAPISGSGNLTATAPAAATLTLSGSRAGHTGQVIAGTNATVLYSNASTINTTSGIGLAGGTAQIRTINSALNSAGSAGLNAIYYNFGSNPGTGANNYATDQLFLYPRAFFKTDLNVNMVNSGSGDWPIIPVEGYSMGTGLVGGQNVGTMWKGLINITTGGSYQFSGTNDDNYVLYIDGVQIGTLGVIATNTNIGGAVNLSAGAHSIVVKHSEGGGGGYATLSYNGPDSGSSTVIVPGSAFTTGSLADLALGPISSNGGGTLDLVGPSSSSGLTLGNGTFTLTSNAVDNLTAAGGVINAATPTLAPTTAGLIVTGAISETGGSRALNFAGPYFGEFQGINTYTGLTTVTGGQLRLNTTGGNSIGTGGLTVNAPNALGALNNVVLRQSNQIADTATVTMTAGILDMGANSDTIGNLVMNGGTISGTTGVLTVNGATPTLTGGTIGVALAGNFTLNKTGAGTAVLSGNGSTYTGVTNVNVGILQAQGTNALGAGGAGNETNVASGASLRTSGASMVAENVSIAGTGITGDSSEAALRNLGGVSQIGNLTTTAASTVRVDSGELIINGTLNVASGAITKTGNGVLTFATNQATVPAVTLSAGVLGFSGTQSFGAASVPAGLGYQFDSNPLSGGGSVSLTVPATSTVYANYAVDQTFLPVFAAGSTGTLALTSNNANNLNFSATPNIGLGARGNVTYTGTITPNAAGFNIGGGGGRISVNSVLAGSAALAINGDTQLNGINTFTGAATINAGGRLAYVNDNSLGTSSNVLNLNGGILQLINASDNTGGTASWADLGYVGASTGGGRVVNVGAAGGTIDIPARQAQGNFAAITSTNGLTGSGALTKTGLGFLEVFTSNNYSGVLTIGANGNRVDLRGQGALPNITGLVLETQGRLDVDNNSTLGSTRVFGSTDNRDRFNNAATITLNGGTLRFVGRNVAFAAGTPATSEEDFGVTTVGVGQSFINSTRTGNGGADLVISNLVRNVGSGTVNFTTDGNTLGISGDNPRIILNQINGVAPTFSSFIGGWATINQSDFAAYGANATIGGAANTVTGIVNYGTVNGTGSAPTYSALTAATAPGSGNWATGVVGSDSIAALALGTAGAGQNFSVRALKFSGGATAQSLTFSGTTGTPDTLFVESGGIITDNGTGAKTVGVTTSNFTRGQLTAGTTTATTPQELFFHNNTAATLTINSSIINNPNNAAATVRVVKAQDGTVVLDSPLNTYSGGTQVLRGTLTANNTGSLGTGSVFVKNSILNLGNKGSTTGIDAAANAAVYTLVDQSTIVLTNGTAGAAGAYNASGDRFSIGTGSTIFANSQGAGFGLNSLTRVATPTSFTAGGQVYLAPGAIVKHNVTNAANQGAGTLTIQNLGTAADLFFAPVTATTSFNQTVTVGAGTPWAGLSSDRGTITWNGGTIYANSDFILQSITRDNGIGQLALGSLLTAANNQGGFQIVNNTNGPINAKVIGNVVINEDEPVLLPSNLTFVLTPGSIFQPNTTMALGFGSTGQAKVVVQAGAILDPGNYTAIGNITNSTRNADGTLNNTQNLPYAVPSPLNGQVSVEAGGKFIINDASGIGSAPAGSYTFKTDSILDLGTANAFFGRGTYGLTQTGTPDTTGLVVPGQFVYEPGTVVHLNVDNVYKISQFTPTDGAYEVYGANRTYTNNNNPFIIPVTGTPTIAPEDFTLTSGGVLTNDSVDGRQLNEGRGRLMLGNGSILAGTSSTYFNIQEGFNLAAGANLTIGTTRYIDGLPKLGAVQLVGPQSNVTGAGATITVTDGAQLAFGAANVFPDTQSLSLPSAVQAFPGTGGSGPQPATGSSLLLNVTNFMEYTGPVTGNGAVIANAAGTALAMNITGNVTSNVVFKNTNGQQPSLMKSGTGTLTLTGNSDAQGVLLAQQGSLVINAGTGDWNELRPQRGASIIVDNTTNATSNRLGLPAFLVGQGGTFELKGNATTAVVEQFGTLASGAGNFIGQVQNSMISTVKVTPGAANTTLQLQAIENFINSGQRQAAYIFSSPSLANLPMAYTSTSGIVPNVSNTANGLVEVITPNFGGGVGGSGLGAGVIMGSSGSLVLPVRNDLLGDADSNGVPEGFVTEDGVNYTSTNTSGTNLVTGLPTTTGLAVGMLVTGAGIPAGTRIATVGANQVTLTNNTTAAATNLNVIVGGLRNLASSEYSSTFRDNQTVGLNVKLSGATTVTGDSRVQTLTLNPGSNLTIGGTLPLNATSSRLLLNSSAIFVPSGGTATITGSTSGNTESYITQIGGSSIFLHTWGDLNLNTKVFSDIGLVKTGPGTVNFGAGAWNGFRAPFQIDGGTVNLAAGNNAQNVRSQNGSTTAVSLYVNAGTLNLGGNSQMINLLNSANELPGQGGTVTSATAATILNTGGGRFAGNLDGLVSLDKTGNNTLLLTGAQTYTGTTTLRAGTLQLRDSAALSATAGTVTLRDATLLLDNSYLSNVTNRINPATPVDINGGTISMTGAAGQVASQTINTLTMSGGRNDFVSNAGGSGANELIINNLVRTPGAGSVLNFNQNYGFIGTAGNTSTAIRYMINNVNGSPVATNDNILGGWAIVRGTNFATYRAGVGVGEMGNTADGFAAYDSGDVTAATATQNVNDGTARTLAASKTVNSWRMGPGANITNTYNNGVGLTIDTGAMLSDAAFTISHNAAADARGNFITSNSGELIYWVNQNTNGFNIPVTGAIDLVKSGAGALNLAPSSLLTATVTAGTNVITTTNTTGLEVGDAVSAGTASIFPAGTVITAINPGVSITLNNNVTTAGADYRVTFGNTYTGKTIVNAGTLTLNQVASGPAAFAVPGDLYVTGIGSVVTEANVGGQINPTANVTIGGGARLNMVAVAGVTENINSLTFLDGSGSNATANGFDRTALQITSTVNLTAATAITSTNTNPSAGTPFIGGFIGNVSFSNPTGATLNINSPTAVNGVLAVGLRFGGRISTVPTGVTEGGLIKAGTGLLTLDPDQNPTFGGGTTAVGSAQITGFASTTGLQPGMLISGTNIPAGAYIISVDSGTQVTMSVNATVAGATGTVTGQAQNFFGHTVPTAVLNIQSGVVRVDRHGSLGSPLDTTTVQNGAVLLGANNANQIITGSVTLKDGATLGATINAFTLGAASDSPANATVLTVPTGANATIAAYDYYVPSTNSGNITINGKLTGGGNINLYGQQVTQGNGGGGVITLGNPIVSGTGSNDFSGTITVGTNAILQNQIALIAKNTAIIRSTGSALGTATINLNGGRLRFRDDATTGAAGVNNTAVTFGNAVTLSANSFLDVGRVNTADTTSGNIIDLGTLTVAAGTKALTVDSNTATTAGAGLGNYITRFASLDGSGTLVKGGGGRLQFTAIAPTFTGGITIAGPQGIAVAGTTNNLILPTSATLPAFTVGGFYASEGAKTLNVTGALTVTSNAGDIASNKSNVPGVLAVTNTTTLTAGSVVNNGVIGATGGTATIGSAGGYSGTGHYLSFNQQLNLFGGSLNGIKVAGNNTVNANGLSNVGGARIESGTLKLTPTSAATSSGTITVLASPASTASATTAAISAVSGTLNLDGTAGSITHTGSITNNGTVRASAGTITISGSIDGTTLGYTPGLLEGYTTVPGGAMDVSNTRAANPGNFGIRLEPRMLQMNVVTQNALTGHTDNDTWVYTGYVKDDDGVFSFAENIDDRAAVWIDGALALNASNGGTSRVVSTAFKDGQAGTGALTAGSNLGTPSQNFGPGISLPGFGSGWHLVEIRMNNGTGGAGPINGNGFSTNYGFGYKNGIAALDGGDMIKPIDDGTGNLFVTPVGGKGSIQVDASSTLNVGSFSLTSAVTFNGGASSNAASLNVTGGNSSTDGIAVTGTSNPKGNIDVANGFSVTAGTLTVANNGTLSVNPTSNGTVVVTGANTLNTGSLVDVVNGTLNIDTTSVGSGNGSVQVETGARLVINGSLGGTVNVGIGATLKGAGTIAGASTLGIGSTLQPDRTSLTTALTFNNTLLLGTGTTYEFEAKANGLSDSVVFSGPSSGLTISGDWTVKLSDAGFGAPGGATFVLFDGDTLASQLNGASIGNPTIDYGTTGWSGGIVSYDAPNNDIILTGVVPEPGSAALLLGGLALLTGTRRKRRS